MEKLLLQPEKDKYR